MVIDKYLESAILQVDAILHRTLGGDMSSSNNGMDWAALGRDFAIAGVAHAMRRYIMASSEQLRARYSDAHREMWMNTYTDLHYKLMTSCKSAEEVAYVNKGLEHYRVDTLAFIDTIPADRR